MPRPYIPEQTTLSYLRAKRAANKQKALVSDLRIRLLIAAEEKRSLKQRLDDALNKGIV